MSHIHHQHGSRGSGIPLKAPPPPTIKDFHPARGNSRPRHGRFPRSRSRSRSPTGRSRQGPRMRYDAPRPGGYGDNRERRMRRSRSPAGHGRSSSVIKEEPTSSSSYPTYVGNAEDSHHRLTNQQQINRIPPVDPSDNTIVRTILAPENVKIPRRENEGLRPIFDRDELREAIKRRIESGDNEQNPNFPEQRVVAIIREPLPMAPQFMQQEIIPILPSQYMADQMIPQQPQTRFETSTGVTYSYSKERSRSRSAARQEPRAEKEREGRGGSPKRERRRMNSGEGFRGRRRMGGPGRRSRSRSGSPVGRVDRSYRVGGFRGRLGPPVRGSGYRDRRGGSASIPNRGPWKHDMYGEEDASEEQRHRTRRND